MSVVVNGAEDLVLNAEGSGKGGDDNVNGNRRGNKTKIAANKHLRGSGEVTIFIIRVQLKRLTWTGHDLREDKGYLLCRVLETRL